MPVAGIGTVVLPVKKAPGRACRNAHSQLVLRDVLHIPSIVCSIIGYPTTMQEEYEIKCKFGDQSSRDKIKDTNGRSVAYFEPRGPFLQVKLSGPPVGPTVGPSVFNDRDIYMISTMWPAAERTRWEEYKRRSPTSRGPQQDFLNAPFNVLSESEKQWLKSHFGNEFHFLQQHGLSIHKEEDREEGRAILRRFMETKNVGGYVGRTGDDEELLEDDEDDFAEYEGHMADYHFDKNCLDWIEQHYGNSEAFMASYGLRFYEDDDCKAANQLVRTLMLPHT